MALFFTIALAITIGPLVIGAIMWAAVAVIAAVIVVPCWLLTKIFG